MSLQSVIDTFTTILNRGDCTAAQAQIFVLQAISRIQRDCRLPSMERTLIITPTGTTNMFPVPLDLIQPIDVLVQDVTSGRFKALAKKSYRKLLEYDPTDLPKVYARNQTQIWIAGSAGTGQQIMFIYYGNFSPFASLAADNELTASTPDLAVYGALSYAADNFEHPSAQAWEARFQQIKTEVMAMAIDLDAEGGPQSVQPLYFDDDWECP